MSKKIYCITLCKDGGIIADYILEGSAFLPIMKKISINGLKRPIYKVGLLPNAHIHYWSKVDASLLSKHYTGDKKVLHVYIQDHALRRMEERLYAMGAFSRNFILTITFPQLSSIESYKGYLVIPIELGEVCVAYLFCHVIEEMLVIRSFLFITHSATPEGDSLKAFTGIHRSDISYWKIDRLSTLFKIKEEQWVELLRISEAVGIKNIQSLNIEGLGDKIDDKDLSLDSFIDNSHNTSSNKLSR